MGLTEVCVGKLVGKTEFCGFYVIGHGKYLQMLEKGLEKKRFRKFERI